MVGEGMLVGKCGGVVVMVLLLETGRLSEGVIAVSVGGALFSGRVAARVVSYPVEGKQEVRQTRMMNG